MLEKSLAHPQALLREKAIETALRQADTRIIPALQRATHDENSRVRAAAGQGFLTLAATRNPAMDAALAEIISSSPDHELRILLLPVAAAAHCDSLLQAVIKCLVDDSASMRELALSSLQTHAPHWMVSVAATQAEPGIKAALHSTSAAVAESATKVSETLQRTKVRRTMLVSGVATMLTLNTALRGDSALLREAAAWALQQSGDVRAVPALVDALQDADESVRGLAAVGLTQFGWSAATEAEHAAHVVALGRWEAAAKLGSAAVDALILAARKSRPSTQAQAIQCLAATKSIRALQPLQELLSTSNRAVRQAAAHALQSLEWVPSNPAQAVAHAIELEQWQTAATWGHASVAPLVAALRTTHGEPARLAAITEALCSIRDVAAARALTVSSRDGEVAAAALQALSKLVEHQAKLMTTDDLTQITALQNIVQFQFTVEPSDPRPVRSGLAFINTDHLRARAAAELARRSSAPAEAAPP